MAEMNELLEQAIQECEGLTAEAESFADALTEMGRVSGEEEDLLRQARANVETMQRSLADMKQRNGQLDQREAEEQGELQRLDVVLEEREAEVAESREKLDQALRELLDEKERLADALRSAHEHGREELEALRERFQELEEQAEQQLERSEEAVERLEEAVRSAMDGVRESQAALMDAIERTEDETTARVDGLVEEWEATVQRVEARGTQLGDAVTEATGEALEQVQQAFQEEVPRVLDEACGELGSTLEALAEDAREHGQVTNVTLQDLVQRQTQTLQAMSNIMAKTHDMAALLIRSVS